MSHSSGSNNYYRSERNRDDRSLPPLKEHLGDIYYNTGTSGHSSVNSHPPRPQHSTQPPRHHSNSYDGSYQRTPSHNSSHNYAPQTHSTHSREETESAGHQYGLFKIAAGHLVHERSSTVDRFPSKPRQETNDPRRQYVCDVCQERFDRPISLETHSVIHTDMKPYKCTVENCNKAFNVLSNQRRHVRTHYAESGFEPVEEDDHRNGSSRSSSASQTSALPANSSYYSSSRRK